MILVPVKNLLGAKQRLAALLDQPTRTTLAQAMLLDVLDAIHAWPNRPAVALVTSDEFAAGWARKYGFETIPDHANLNETDAVEMATQICAGRGANRTLVLPADIPLVQPAELEQIVQCAPNEGSVLVPSADSRGTNAVWRSPAALFPLRFGNDSFKPHLAAAHATGKPCVVLSLPGIGLDIDNPADLHELAAIPGETRAQRFARQFDLAELPSAANQ